MFLLVLERRALTNALPRMPTPAGSVRPRAKTTSTAGHAADADGVMCGDSAGATSRAAATSTTTTPAVRWRRITKAMLAEGIDALAVKSRSDGYRRPAAKPAAWFVGPPA